LVVFLIHPLAAPLYTHLSMPRWRLDLEQLWFWARFRAKREKERYVHQPCSPDDG
jgi:hypothetical protein